MSEIDDLINDFPQYKGKKFKLANPTKKSVGEREILVMKAIRDHPNKAYSKGINEILPWIKRQAINDILMNLRAIRLIVYSDKLPESFGMFGTRIKLHVLAKAGMDILKKHEEA